MQITIERLREALAGKLGSVLTPELAAEVLTASLDCEDRAIDPQGFAPARVGGLVFQVESFRDILPELEPLHQRHFAETERHLPDESLDPDYDYMAERERMGSLLQFTARDGARNLVGNLRVYLGKSTHTGRRFAEEDTIYLLPEARRAGVADAFMDYAEGVLVLLGMEEARADTKLVNLAGKWLQRRGYQPVATKHIKLLRKE